MHGGQLIRNHERPRTLTLLIAVFVGNRLQVAFIFILTTELVGRTNQDTDHHRNKRSKSTSEEFREIRRIQKKKVERRRRSSILDKMMNLYRLTMDLIGRDVGLKFIKAYTALH
ncbi:hypothetical protein AHF37_02453 [Paragonimus kellicotti]|nr:hypothetical protein AHF37_02453 [Paragonimus kellicotti]